MNGSFLGTPDIVKPTTAKDESPPSLGSLEMSFGYPDELLPSRNSRPSTSHQTIDPRPGQHSFVESQTSSQAPEIPDAAGAPMNPADDMEADRNNTQIPSSRSPSPIMSLRPDREPHSTPKAAVISAQVTKQLTDNIAALLGKRKSEGSGNVSTRPGKRQRPRRPKVRLSYITHTQSTAENAA